MKGFRDKKNSLKRIFYETNDYMITKMEDSEIETSATEEAFTKLIEHSNEYAMILKWN